jgi:hypothetical protein
MRIIPRTHSISFGEAGNSNIRVVRSGYSIRPPSKFIKRGDSDRKVAVSPTESVRVQVQVTGILGVSVARIRKN